VEPRAQRPAQASSGLNSLIQRRTWSGASDDEGWMMKDEQVNDVHYGRKLQTTNFGRRGPNFKPTTKDNAPRTRDNELRTLNYERQLPDDAGMFGSVALSSVMSFHAITTPVLAPPLTKHMRFRRMIRRLPSLRTMVTSRPDI
jgi:hypothetical protein